MISQRKLVQSEFSVQKHLCDLRTIFKESSETFGKCSEIFGKSRKGEVNYCTCPRIERFGDNNHVNP